MENLVCFTKEHNKTKAENRKGEIKEKKRIFVMVLHK